MGFMQFLPSTWRAEAAAAPGHPIDPLPAGRRDGHGRLLPAPPGDGRRRRRAARPARRAGGLRRQPCLRRSGPEPGHAAGAAGRAAGRLPHPGARLGAAHRDAAVASRPCRAHEPVRRHPPVRGRRPRDVGPDASGRPALGPPAAAVRQRHRPVRSGAGGGVPARLASHAGRHGGVRARVRRLRAHRHGARGAGQPLRGGGAELPRVRPAARATLGDLRPAVGGVAGSGGGDSRHGLPAERSTRSTTYCAPQEGSGCAKGRCRLRWLPTVSRDAGPRPASISTGGAAGPLR